jgi:hypothetical protein
MENELVEYTGKMGNTKPSQGQKKIRQQVAG